MSKCAYDNNGICDVTGKPCSEVILCTPETVYIEKEKEDET